MRVEEGARFLEAKKKILMARLDGIQKKLFDGV